MFSLGALVAKWTKWVQPPSTPTGKLGKLEAYTSQGTAISSLWKKPASKVRMKCYQAAPKTNQSCKHHTWMNMRWNIKKQPPKRVAALCLLIG